MIAWLAPGQGSQHAAMFAGRRSPHLEAALSEASAGAGRDLRPELEAAGFDRAARPTQLALLVAAVASGRELTAADVPCHALAGHSAGAFAAAVLGGVLPLSRAAAIVDERARLMEKAFGDGYGMAAIVGFDVAAVDRLVADAGGPEARLFRANVNAARQIVVAGARPALARAVALALSRGARTARLLDVSVPSHCPLLEPIAAQLAAGFGDEPVAAPCVPIAGNLGGRLLSGGRRVLDDALANVAHPVRWDLAVGALYEAGARLFVELRPGRVLSDLAAAEFPAARAIALEDAEVDGVLPLAARTLRLP